MRRTAASGRLTVTYTNRTALSEIGFDSQKLPDPLGRKGTANKMIIRYMDL